MGNPKNPLKIFLVRDMWLTDFDTPSLHTMSVDKPMRSLGFTVAKDARGQPDPGKTPFVITRPEGGFFCNSFAFCCVLAVR